jgi:uncharacterized ion transporter superfamily protein YfcC
VVAGTFHPVDPRPVGLFAAIVALPRGLIDAGEIVFLIFLVGGAFTVVDRTGALKAGIEWLVRLLGSQEALILPIVSLAFALGGILYNLQEEIIAIIPVVVLLCRRMGYPPLVAGLVTIGPAMVGSAFSPMNPFQTGLAQKIAELPLLSGWQFRSVVLFFALALWIASSTRYAARHRREPEDDADPQSSQLGLGHAIILGLVALTFAIMVWGLFTRDWGFNQLSGLFFIMGTLAGFIGLLGLEGTAKAYADGFREMAFAAIVVGFARAIFVVLHDGRVVDTIVHGLFTLVAQLPMALSALGMMAGHVAIHFPVPSVTGHAVLTLPILIPVSDLLGLSRQVTVLCYQYAGGLSDLIVPTNGSLLAILAAGGLRYGDWIRWTLPRFLALLLLGATAVLVAIAIGL